MKIAIINLDKGNEDENLGNDLVESLKEKRRYANRSFNR
mgnify:FL=1